MDTLKGFITIYHRIDNVEGAVAPVGELSAHSYTFSSEKEIYNKSDYDGYRLTVFSNRDGDGNTVDVEDGAVEESLKIASWLNSFVDNNVVINDPALVQQAILTNFPDLTKVVVGEMVKVNNDYFPSSLELVNGTTGKALKLWFADSHFRQEYDEYEIKVIHPVKVLDDMLRPYEEFNPILSAVTYVEQMARVNAITTIDPATVVKPLTYDWYDQNDSRLTTRVSWTLIVYGQAGDNLERLQNAIIEQVLGETNGTDDQWQTAVPDLFSPTEYWLIPGWHRFAIPNQGLVVGIHSPFTDVADINKRAGKFFLEQPDDHIDVFTEATTAIYKSLSLVTIGSKTNRNNIYRVSELFPDYMIVSSTSPDFARLAPATQEWVLLVHNMLAAADLYATSGSLPEEMVLVEREGIKYVLSTLDGKNYLIPERKSYLDHYAAGDD